MRGVMAVVRVLVVLLVIGFIANCADGPTAPERSVANQPSVALATAGDGNGLSITTDKDDYAPGDTVWFTGAGWTPGDTLDILLTDSVDVHNWWVGIDEGGGFRDSTYVVDVNDIGVTFTLTATNRRNPNQTLTVIFTDGNPQVNTITLSPTRPNPGISPFTASFTVTTVGTGPGGSNITTWAATGWRIYPRPGSASGTFTCVDKVPDQTTETTSAPQVITLTTPAVAGDYTLDVQTYDNNTCAGNPVGNGAKKDFTVGISDLTITKSHSGNFTAGSTGTYTIIVTNSGTGITDAPVTVTDVLPSGFSYNAASGNNWVCTQTPAGTASCTRGGGNNAIAAGASADAITLTVNVASNAAASINNVATVAIGNGGNESNTGNNSASDPTTVVPAVTPASKLAFTSSALSVVVGECSPKVTVQTQTGPGAATNPSTNVTVNLTSSSTGGTFFGDAACSSSITNRLIQTTGNTADFYYKDSKAGTPKLTATDAAANLTAAEQTETVGQAATTTSISSVSPSPATFGQQVTVNYAVSVTLPGSGTPTGSVEVKNGSDVLCSALVAAGSCSFYPTGAGALSLTASYQGDANYSSSTSSPATSLTVDPAPTTTTIGTVSPSPATFGQQVTVNFSVVPKHSGTYGSVMPTGTVQVKNGSVVLCSGTVASGSCAFYPGGAGTLSLTGNYQGDANFALSASSPATSLTVNRAPTTTTIGTVSPSPATFGQQVTVNFGVLPKNSGTYGSVVPTGTVQVKNGADLLCSASVATGNCKFYPAAVGTLSLSADYIGISPDFDGDANFLASSTSATTSLTVNRAPTTTTITSPPANASYVVNAPVMVNFKVEPKNTGVGYDYGSVLPTGTVQVKNGTTLLCHGSLSSGAGSCNFTASSVGGYTLKAYYLGDASSYPGVDENADANFLASESSGTAITVSYNFSGLFAPVDAVPTLNSAKAGQAIPLKWRLTDYNGAPVLDFSAAALGVAVSGMNCTVTASIDAIEEYAGNSGLQNLGDGYYQFNWKSPPSYAGTCRKIGLNLGEGFTREPLGYFQFKK